MDDFEDSGGRTVARRRQSDKGWFVGIAALVLTACATSTSIDSLTQDSPPELKKEVVAARATARWNALIKGDLVAAYAYLSPASRATIPLDAYKGSHRVGMYRGVKIDSVDCDADVCTVELRVTFDYKRTKGVDMPLVEKWLITEGKAWFVERG